MNIYNFELNSLFQNKSKSYQTRPVRAARYQKGMESGYMVYFTNVPCDGRGAMAHEGIRFFDTEHEAWYFCNANQMQYAIENGVLTGMEVEYDTPKPVLHRKEPDKKNRMGRINCFEGQYAFISNETEQYDFFILEENAWIIQEMDGTIRVWYDDMEDETFFGNEKDIVYEKVEGKEEYIKVAV